jgi:hypothetical protein
MAAFLKTSENHPVAFASEGVGIRAWCWWCRRFVVVVIKDSRSICFSSPCSLFWYPFAAAPQHIGGGDMPVMVTVQVV